MAIRNAKGHIHYAQWRN